MALLSLQKLLILKDFLNLEKQRQMGLLHGLLWAQELGVQQNMFQLDCKNAMDDISGSSIGNSYYNALLSRCRTLLSNFSNSLVN